MYIPIILGTAREGRRAEKAAKFVLQEVANAGIETELIDVRDFPISATGEQAPALQELGEKFKRADGYIIVTPEYNHGYPGELKQLLDSFYNEYARKPIGFCGVSGGILGGARAIEQLRLVAIELHMVPIREAVYFGNITNLFDEQGNIQDPSYAKRVQTLLGELLWYAKALKPAREEGR